MGDLLSFPRQATSQSLAQPGATTSQCVLETPFYPNRPAIDARGFPRGGPTEPLRAAPQDPYPVTLRPRGAYYDAVYPVDEFRGGAVDRRQYLCRPSTPTVSPVRLPGLRMPCPLISITSDSEIPSIVYQDDESDGKITEEEEEDAAEHGEVATAGSSFDPFERIATPPYEYAEAAKDRSLLTTQPLNFHANVFDNIPYIDQGDEPNPAESPECARGHQWRDKCERFDGNSNFGDSQRCVDVAGFPLLPNRSALVVKDVAGSRNSDHDVARGDDVSNSEDYADESSSTINDDCASSRAEEEVSAARIYTAMPELHLDLSGLNSDVSSDESRAEKCWKSPEEVRLGCGRVAALAKHFSKLGDAGLIKFKSTRLTDFRQFVSEPSIAASRKSDEQHLCPRCAQKGCKSDSDLTENGDLEECGFHDRDAERIQTDSEGFCVIENDRDRGSTSMKDGSRLSLRQQQVIAQQLEQFSNLDDADAPLFIPEQSASQVSPKNEEIADGTCDDSSTRSNLTDQSADRSRGTRRTSGSCPPLSFSLPSVHLPSASPALSLPRSPSAAEDSGSRRVYRCISPLKSRSDETLKGSRWRSRDDKVNAPRVRRPLCGSEGSLIDAAVCEEEETRRDRTRDRRSTMSGKLSSDENLDREIDSNRTSCDEVNPKLAGRTYHRSLEELKSGESASPGFVRAPRRLGDKSASEDGRKTRWSRHRSFEVLESEEESGDSRANPAVARLPRSDCRLKEKFRAKRASHDRLRGSALELSRETGDEERAQRWRAGRKSRSELDVSKREPDSERDFGWSFREIGSPEDDDQSASRKPAPMRVLAFECASSRNPTLHPPHCPSENGKVIIRKRIDVA